MPQQLINRSPDLKKLRDYGYEIEIRQGYLIIHHIPYLNVNHEIKYGKLISTLSMNSDATIKPDNHVMGFMGEHPCNKDGSIITAIQHSNPNQKLFDGIVMNYSFSNKPPGGFNNYYDKVNNYAEIITSQARSLDSSVTAKTFRVIADNEDGGVFNYVDTNSSRANINQLNLKFKSQRIGIIGLGGTGSYILDMVAKTQVMEIQLYDGDIFLQHNAFRSPGAPSIESLNMQYKKVDYFTSIYSKMHKGIKPFPINVTDENIDLLEGLSYVFICVDNNSARGIIMSNLIQLGIDFIDVGFGVNIADNNLIGTVRVTCGTKTKSNHLSKRIGTAEIDDNEYSTNIQVADLNALNALMAVLKWKKLSGFYQDLLEEHHSTYIINTSQLINNDFTA
jgi:hypothetical protein